MDTNKKVVRIGITYDQRMRNEKGSGYVPCEVSGRYLMFNNYVSDDGFVFANVMTNNGFNERKICELVLKYEDLVNAINHMNKA